ncbi:alpha/beta hydrolase [Streptomyces sp. NPDC048717]|uniref:alpha/beta hydrolase family protein n=1 Tax=Streptomyces sp. NPDC048717 TaxID=3154928 RepID=UPI0034268D18
MIISRAGEPLIRVLYDESRADLRDPARPRPVRVYQWEPDEPLLTPAPLIVLSHGTGGSGGTMTWLAGPLRAAGFRVVALDHHGNNFVDGYEPEGFLQAWERPRDVTFVLDTLAGEGPLGPVGAAGFSLGGYTVAALAGARLDPAALWAVLAGEVPVPEIPEFPGAVDAWRQKYPLDEAARRMVDGAAADLSDARVRAVFQVAPGLGALVTRKSLRGVRVPAGIRWGGADTVNPYDADTRPYLEGIPTSSGHSAGPDVRHDDFFAPEPVDPDARVRVGGEAADFFVRHLGGVEPHRGGGGGDRAEVSRSGGPAVGA